MARRPRKTDEAKAFNAQFGTRIRSQRKKLHLTLQELGQSLGVTYQQVQKYEKGDTGITVDRLIELSRALKAPAAYFFGGEDAASGFAEAQQGFGHNTHEATELVEAFRRIARPELREHVLALVKGMADAED